MQMNKEEKEAIDRLYMKATLYSADAPEYPNSIVMKKDLVVLLDLLEKQNKEISKLRKKNNNLLSKLRNRIKQVNKLTKYSNYKKEFSSLNRKIEKQEKIIKDYENECRRFKAFCKRIRKDEKRNVDEFNQGQEQKCNEFLNLISGEPHWLYEGKYFDETDKEVEYFKKEVEKDV